MAISPIKPSTLNETNDFGSEAVVNDWIITVITWSQLNNLLFYSMHPWTISEHIGNSLEEGFWIYVFWVLEFGSESNSGVSFFNESSYY